MPNVMGALLNIQVAPCIQRRLWLTPSPLIDCRAVTLPIIIVYYAEAAVQYTQ